MAQAPVDQIFVAGKFKVDIQDCATSADCVSTEVDPIEIEMHDVTQSNDSNWKQFTNGAVRYGEARFTFRVAGSGFTKDLATWTKDCGRGQNIRKNITITIMKRDGSAGRTYNLVETFPLSFSGGDFTTGAESNLAELRVCPTRVEIG